MELLFDLSFSYRKLFFFSLTLSLFPSSNTVSSYHFGPFWYYCWPVWSSAFSALLQVLDLSFFLMPKLTGRMKSKAKREGLHIRVCAKFSLVGSFSPWIWERKQPSNCCGSQHVDRYVNASVFWAFINPAYIKVKNIQVGERKEDSRIRFCNKFSLVGLLSPWIWDRKQQPLNHLSSQHVDCMTLCVVSILLTLLTSRLRRFRYTERKLWVVWEMCWVPLILWISVAQLNPIFVWFVRLLIEQQVDDSHPHWFLC